MHNRITMNRLSIQQRVQVINALVEGNSIRATCRMTGTAKGTVLRLLAEVGEACAKDADSGGPMGVSLSRPIRRQLPVLSKKPSSPSIPLC
jgi:hypothetical protein